MRRRRSDAQPLLRYATVTEHAPMYRAIMELFSEAAAGYTSRLRVEDVHAALVARLGEDIDGEPPSVAEVRMRLGALYEWGNLSQDHDTSRATSLDGYGGVAYVYDLTPGGEAAQEALVTLEDGLRRVGGLQAVALRQIEELLAQLTELVGADEPNGDDVYRCCEELHSRFRSLTGNAALFMQKVNKLLSSPVIEGEEFALFKADTIAYLNDFLADLDTLATEIRRHLNTLDAHGAVALRRALSAGERASGELTLLADDPTIAWATLTAAHVAGVGAWFRAGPDAHTGAAILYLKARDAILGITRVAERIREAAESPSSRASDLLDLAARFESCSDDNEAHTLWHVAFGLSPARHIGVVAENHLPPSTSWWDPDARVVISKTLRISGRTDYVRRATHVRDRSIQKRHLAQTVSDAQQRNLAAADTLVKLGDVLISEINSQHGGPLDPPTLKLLAGLLSRAARARPRRDGTRNARSLDGTLLITTGPPQRAAAQLEATTGTWTMPDRRVRIELAAQVRESDRADADRSGTAALAALADQQARASADANVPLATGTSAAGDSPR